MSDPSARTFTADFKRFFLRGLVVLLPSVLTLWIVVKAYQFVDGAIAEPINNGVRLTLNEAASYWKPLREKFDPSEQEIDSTLAVVKDRITTRDAIRFELRYSNIQKWWLSHWYMNLIGLVVAIVSVYVAGRLLGGFLGRRFYRRIERLITTLPVFKQVYPYVKQIVDFLFSDDTQVKFSRVVMIEYPRKGVWSLGFHTGKPLPTGDGTSDLCVSVFIPSSPTPFTGYVMNVPIVDVVEIPITVEEAIRFLVSCGVLVPESSPLPIMPTGNPPFPIDQPHRELVSATSAVDLVNAAAQKSLAERTAHGTSSKKTT